MDAADFVFRPEPSVTNAEGPSFDDGPGFEPRPGTVLSIGQSSGNTSDWNMHGYDDDPDGDGPAPDPYVGTLDDDGM